MIAVPLSSERYVCDSPGCGKVVEADSDEKGQVQMEWDWECPDCHAPFTIYAKNDLETIRAIFKRKKAHAIEEGDFVLVNIVGDTLNQHEVDKIDIGSNGKVNLRLLGHGWRPYLPDSMVTCVMGAW